MEEFIVDRGQVPQLEEYKEKIERMYEVKIGFEDITTEDAQWIAVRGENLDRQNAKEYIVAVCNPKEKQCFKVPDGCFNFLTNEKLEHIEKLTKAVMVYSGESSVTITGTDLGVTLAMSSLEDLIVRICDTEEDGIIQETKVKDTSADESTSPWAQRLDTSLQRALSQQSDGNCCLEDYDNTPASVKRVILQCLNDSNSVQIDDIDDELLFSPHTPKNTGGSPYQYKLPVLIGDENGYSANKSTRKKSSDHVDGQMGNLTLTQQLTNSDAAQASASSSRQSPMILPNSKLSKELEYLRNFGQTVGYSSDVIEEGLKFADENTQVSDFIEILLNISDSKSKSSESSRLSPDIDKAVSSVSTTPGKFPPPPPIPSQSKLADMTGRRSLPQEYKSKLLNDFSEEEKNDLPIEELKRRNEERQQVLKASFDDDKSPIKSRNLSSPRQDKGDKNGHQNKGGQQQKGKGAKKKKNKQKGQQQSVNTSVQCIEIDEDEEETCVMEHWKDDVDDDCRIVDVSQPPPMPVFAQPTKPPHQQQHTNNRQPYGNAYQRPFGAVPSSQHVPASRAPPPHSNEMAAGCKSDGLRYIVIDGSNVAMGHGNGKIFSCRGIQICINHFLKRGHKQITVFVPEWRKYRPRMENQIQDQNLLTELKEDGHLVFTPSRRVNGKLISSYDDRFVLELAEREDGVIVSNDQYRDLMQEKASWRTLVEERLLMFTFAGDNFMIPEDPLGQDGPTLDQLLHKAALHAGPIRKRPLSPEKVERGYFRQQDNWNNMPPVTRVGNARFPYQNNQQRGLLPPPFMQRPILHKGNQENFHFRQNQADGVAAAFRGAHRGRGQRYPHPQANKFTALASRSDESTEELFTQLKSIFTEEAQELKLREVLQNHREETDLNRLTNYCMNAIFS